MYRSVDGWMVGWMDRWKDGWADRSVIFVTALYFLNSQHEEDNKFLFA